MGWFKKKISVPCMWIPNPSDVRTRVCRFLGFRFFFFSRSLSLRILLCSRLSKCSRDSHRHRLFVVCCIERWEPWSKRGRGVFLLCHPLSVFYFILFFIVNFPLGVCFWVVWIAWDEMGDARQIEMLRAKVVASMPLRKSQQQTTLVALEEREEGELSAEDDEPMVLLILLSSFLLLLLRAFTCDFFLPPRRLFSPWFITSLMHAESTLMQLSRVGNDVGDLLSFVYRICETQFWTDLAVAEFVGSPIGHFHGLHCWCVHRELLSFLEWLQLISSPEEERNGSLQWSVFRFLWHNFCLILCGLETSQCFCNPVPYLGFLS